jgi:erythromycin esterase
MPGSLDDLLHRVNLPAFVLVTRDAAGIEGLNRPRGHRAIGVTYNPAVERQGNYVSTDPTRRYDVLIYIEQTRPLRPLHQ